MSDVPILKETTRSTGREALRNNITAAMALAGAVRSTLGPRGMDKLLIDDEGRTMVTNDGVTVLESAQVEHPVAKMLINASTTQDRIARDGTTSAVLFSAELLQNAWELVLQGVHPSAIGRGYRMAEAACRERLNTLVIEATPERQRRATETSLAGKIHSAMQTHLAEVAHEAARAVVEERSGDTVADPTRVKVLTNVGGQMTDSHLVTGLALPKKRVTSSMPRRLSAGRVALIDGGLERKGLMSDVKLNLTSPGMLEAFRAKERTLLLEQIDHLTSLGVTLLACKEGIDDDVHGALAEAGIQAFRRVARADLDLLARGCGARLNLDVKALTGDDVGVFIESRNERVNGKDRWTVDTEEGVQRSLPAVRQATPLARLNGALLMPWAWPASCWKNRPCSPEAVRPKLRLHVIFAAMQRPFPVGNSWLSKPTPMPLRSSHAHLQRTRALTRWTRCFVWFHNRRKGPTKLT